MTIKNLFSLLALHSFVSVSFADVADIDLSKFDKKKGKYQLSYNGNITEGAVAGQAQVCNVAKNSEYQSVSIVLPDDLVGIAPTPFYFAKATDASKGEVKVYTREHSGKRPGGSVCGDGLSVLLGKVHETLTIDGDKVEILESFRCVPGGKSVSLHSCKF
jgi:hypothetical protein